MDEQPQADVEQFHSESPSHDQPQDGLAAPRRRLGRGISSLLGGLAEGPTIVRESGAAEGAAGEFTLIAHEAIARNPYQPRKEFDEAALAEMGRQQILLIRHGQEPRISPNDWPPQRLYSIAGPLLMSLRPDQKDQVRRLCRSLGFEQVASLL